MLHSYFIFFKENILFTNNAKHRTLPHFLPVLKPIFPPEQVSAAATPSSSSVNRGKGTNTKHNPSSKQIAGKGKVWPARSKGSGGVLGWLKGPLRPPAALGPAPRPPPALGPPRFVGRTETAAWQGKAAPAPEHLVSPRLAVDGSRSPMKPTLLTSLGCAAPAGPAEAPARGRPRAAPRVDMQVVTSDGGGGARPG